MSNKLQLRRSSVTSLVPSLWQLINAWEPFVNIQDEKMYISKWDWTFFTVWWELQSLPTYTVTNDTEDRVIDADNITINKLADILSTFIKDAQQWLVWPAWTYTSKIRASMSVWQSIPNNTYTTVVFDSEDYDEDSEFNISTWIFTATITWYYSVKTSIWINWMVASQNFWIRLYKNTSIICEKNMSSWETGSWNQDISSDIYLNAWDTIKVQVLQDSWSSKTTQTNIWTYISIHRFG